MICSAALEGIWRALPGEFDKAAFGHQGDFGQAHQALLKALDRAADFIRN
jgi:hypothetical protein